MIGGASTGDLASGAQGWKWSGAGMEGERGGDGRGAGWKGSGGQDESARGVFAGGRTKARGENVAPKVVHSFFLVVGDCDVIVVQLVFPF